MASNPKRTRRIDSEKSTKVHKVTRYSREYCWNVTGFSSKFPLELISTTMTTNSSSRHNHSRRRKRTNITYMGAGDHRSSWSWKIKAGLYVSKPSDTNESGNLATSLFIVNDKDSHTDDFKESGIEVSFQLVDKCGAKLLVPGNGGLIATDNGARWEGTFCSLRTLYAKKEKYFPDDILRMVTIITVMIKEKKQEYEALNDLALSMLHMYTQSIGCDMVIQCEGKEFKVHQNILAARSEVFAKMFMLGIDRKGKKKKRIIIEDIGADVFGAMLLYMYSSYINLAELGFEKICGLTQAADKYRLEKLKHLCFNYMSNIITDDSVGQLASLAWLYGSSSIVQYRIIKYCTENFHRLHKNEDFKTAVGQTSIGFLDYVQLRANIKAKK